MNPQFKIEHILMSTYNRYLMQPGYEDTRPYQYQVFFQINGYSDRFYVVRSDQDTPARLWKINGHNLMKNILDGEIIKDPVKLAIERPNLGKVFIKFDNKLIKEYNNFDEFWEDVGQ